MAREYGESIVNRWIIAGIAALGLLITVEVSIYGHLTKQIDANRAESDSRWADAHKEIVSLADKIQIHANQDSHVGTAQALKAINQRLDDANVRNSEDHKEIKGLLNRIILIDPKPRPG